MSKYQFSKKDIISAKKRIQDYVEKIEQLLENYKNESIRAMESMTGIDFMMGRSLNKHKIDAVVCDLLGEIRDEILEDAAFEKVKINEYLAGEITEIIDYIPARPVLHDPDSRFTVAVNNLRHHKRNLLWMLRKEKKEWTAMWKQVGSWVTDRIDNTTGAFVDKAVDTALGD